MKGKMYSGWLLSLLAIPLLSLFGRPLQLRIIQNVSAETLLLSLTLVFAIMVCIYGVALFQTGITPYSYHLLWVAALALFFYLHLPFVEKIHIALFGLFGFMSQKLFTQKVAAVLSVAISFLDELFQYFLAARVGDWRDVWLNLFSASLGMFLAFLLTESMADRESVNEE